MRVANVVSEVMGKVGVKTLTSDQRRSESTAHRRASAITRRYFPSVKTIEEQLPWARARRRQAEEAAKRWRQSRLTGVDIAASTIQNVLGSASLAHEGRRGSASTQADERKQAEREAEEAAQAAERDEFERVLAAQEDEGEEEDDDAAAAAAAAAAAHSASELRGAASSNRPTVEFRELDMKAKLNLCLVGTILSVEWGVGPDGAIKFYLAVVVPRTEKTGKQSVRRAHHSAHN